MLKIVPLGGLGEIGLNMMVIEQNEEMLIIDSGLMFPEDYMLGVDFVIPDMDYVKQNTSRVSGIVLTHAHEDHIGALPFLLKDVQAPIFGTAYTLAMIRHKLEDREPHLFPEMVEIHFREKKKIGSFDLEFIQVGHSVVDGIAVAIRTPLGLIVHTGDFKISHSSNEDRLTDVNRFARFGEEGVLALLSDSTNVEKEGYTISDKQVGEALEKLIKKSPGRVIIALFASNIARIQEIVDIARSLNRNIIFDGRSIRVSINIAKKLGYLDIPDKMEVDVEKVDSFPDHKIIIITTGSQGEPMSALTRMASGIHKYIKVRPNDTVILSSKFIPGNEKAIAKCINNLYRRGADVIYEKISEIHVSGHAFQEELKLMIRLTRPRYFIPIHGEYRHLVLHARLAGNMGLKPENVLLAENGQVIEFDENGGRLNGSIPTGRVLVDGKGIGDVGKSVLKERRALSEEGFVAVTMALDEETGIIVYGPEIESRGFVFETESGHLLEDAICVVLEIVEDIGPDSENRIETIRNRIQSSLRRYFNFTIKRRPVILPFIMEV